MSVQTELFSRSTEETTLSMNDFTSMPPTNMRSSESVLNQVKETLFHFVNKSESSLGDIESRAKDDNESDGNSTGERNQTPSEKLRAFEAFTKRMNTFTVQNWMGKPLALSPPLLAQYGWQCIGLDTAKCCSCAAILTIRLPWPDTDNYRQRCFEYRQKILANHMKICTWPSYPSPDAHVTPFLHGGDDASKTQTNFIGRKDRLMKLGNRLPELQIELLEELMLDRSSLQKLAQIPSKSGSIVIDDDIASAVKYPTITAAILAMCGWDSKSNQSMAYPSLYCSFTARQVGLWNFFGLETMVTQSKTSSSNPVEIAEAGSKRRAQGESEVSPKKIKKSGGEMNKQHMDIEKTWFHPLQQHYPWSPWIAVLKPVDQNEFEDAAAEDNYVSIVQPTLPNGKPGWRFVRNTLLGEQNVLSTEHSSIMLSSGQELTQKSDKGPDELNASIGERTIADTPRTPKNAVVHVRKMLKEWSSPQ